MALSFNSSGQQENSGSTTNSFSFTNTSGNVLVVFTVNDVVEDLTSVTYNGVSLTSITSQDGASGFVRCQMWYLKSPATGANTLTATRPTGTGGFTVHAVSYAGANTATQPDSYASTTNTSTSTTQTTTVVSANCWLVAGITANSNGLSGSTGRTTKTTGAGQIGGTRIFDSNGTVGTGSQSLTQTMNAGENTGIIISLKAPLDYPITASFGSFTLTGQNSILNYGRTIIASVGYFILTGFDTTLTWFKKWTKQDKNTSVETNQTPSSTTWSNNSKNTSSETNQTKN